MKLGRKEVRMVGSEKYYKVIDRALGNGSLVKANANFVRSVMVVEHVVTGKLMKDYFFDVICEGIPVRELHDEGWVYVHQLNKPLSPYCIGLSARDIAERGLRSNAKNERIAGPPRRLETLFLQCANLICLVAQEVSGATSLNDISTVAAGFLYMMEKKGVKVYSDYELENIWQEFLYNVNLPFRSGNSPFSNITLEFGKPDYKLKEMGVVYGGEVCDVTYSEVPAEYYDRVNIAFIKAMAKGDAIGNPFTFPLITVNIVEDFDWENRAFRMLVEECDKWGGFYVQNYQKRVFREDTEWKRANPYLREFDEGMIYSNCCRVMFDLKLVETVTGTNPFHSGSGVGGIGVFAINMNRLLWLYGRDFDRLMNVVEGLLEVGREVLRRKRKFIREHWQELYPYLSFYVESDRSMYNIFSVVGGHEGLVNAGFEGGVFSEEGREYAHRVMQGILKKVEEFMRSDGELYCVEYAPSESAAVKMAKEDLRLWKWCESAYGGEAGKEVLRRKIENLIERFEGKQLEGMR